MYRTRSRVIPLSFSVLMALSLSAGLTAGVADETLSPATQERLQTIRCLSEQDREGIENHYQDQYRALLATQRLKTERVVTEIPRFQRILWLERLRADRGQRSSTHRLMEVPTPGFWSDNIKSHREMLESYSVGALTDLLMEADSFDVLAAIAGNYREPAELRYVAARLIRETRPYRQAVERLLEEQQDRARFVDAWEKHRESCVLAGVKGQPVGIEAETDGVQLVAIIGDTQRGYACAIRGVDELLRNGDRFQDITVLDVQEDSVSLRRGDQRWLQSLE